MNKAEGIATVSNISLGLVPPPPPPPPPEPPLPEPESGFLRISTSSNPARVRLYFSAALFALSVEPAVLSSEPA